MGTKRLAFVPWALLVFALAFAARVYTQSAPGLDPRAVRQAAVDAGLGSLRNVPVPSVPNLGEFLNPGPEARTAAVVLGKALFWDTQVGSDRQACASCHSHAGTDNRAKNQLNPGLRATPADKAFGNPGVGSVGIPNFDSNYTLVASDFPFHELEDPEERSFLGREVRRDTNDVASSQGVFKALFDGVSGGANDRGTPVADDVFNVYGINVRRVEPRNTPNMINAVFNSDNFWDGRARNQFNGVSPFGLLDAKASILVFENAQLQQKKVVIPNSSLASQAVGPPLSPDEMSFDGRTFPDVGQKLTQIRRGVRLLPVRPLALQRVHPQDSVLGPFSLDPLGQRGLTIASYAALIQAVFQPQYWASPQRVGFDANGSWVLPLALLPGQESFSQMEANFSLFFGLAVQLYETTLVSDQSRFDTFMEGSDAALDQDELRGLLTFINTGAPGQVEKPLFAGVSQGNCVSCHSGPEFTSAAFTTLAKKGLIELEETAELVDGLLAVGEETAFEDTGFSNIGTRPTGEDLGRGGTALDKPLSATRQALAGLSFAPPLPACGGPNPPCPDPHTRALVDGAFKVPGLRGVELSGPYFHNGGQATLGQVVEFYDRQGDFGDANIDSLDPELAGVDLSEGDEVGLVSFLLALTDERVRNERAPFDHPQIMVPNGHPGDQGSISCFATASNGVKQACDDRIEVRAVGRNGRTAEGLPPLGPFLDLPPR